MIIDMPYTYDSKSVLLRGNCCTNRKVVNKNTV